MMAEIMGVNVGKFWFEKQTFLCLVLFLLSTVVSKKWFCWQSLCGMASVLLHSLSQYILDFLSLFYIEQMKPANNLIGRLIVVVTIWRAYKFQAFFCNCQIAAHLWGSWRYIIFNQIKFISLKIVSLPFKGKKSHTNVPRNVRLRSSVGSGPR